MKHTLKFMVAGFTLSVLLSGSTAFAQSSSSASLALQVPGFNIFHWGLGHGDDQGDSNQGHGDQDQNKDDQDYGHEGDDDRGKNLHAPLISGSIVSVGSTTLTVSGKLLTSHGEASGTATFTVDASHAQIVRDGRSAALETLASGDEVMIAGTATGTQVVASMIRDIAPQHGPDFASTTTAVMGTVQSVNNPTFMLSIPRGWFGSETLTVDASHAVVVNDDKATTTLASILAGDHVIVRGTLGSSTLTASSILDLMKKDDHQDQDKQDKHPMPPSFSQGNGAPVIGGTVTAVGSSTLTFTNKGATTYTVNTASSTLFTRGAASSTLGAISVGDRVLVQGNIEGTTITASSVIDEGAASSASSTRPTPMPHGRGILGTIGGFISHLFGFF